MRLSATLAASAAMLFLASAASAQTTFNTDLPELNGTIGPVTVSTVTDTNGTVTTVSGSALAALRVTAPPAMQTGWYQANMGGGGAAGITRAYSNDGDGAAFFASPTGAAKADLQLNFAAPVALSSLKNVSFDFFVDAASTTAAFTPVLRFNIRKNGAFAGSLVLESFYQNQMAAPKGQWLTETSDLTSGIWWATNAALGPTLAAANGGQKSLQAWIDANAGSDLTVVGVNIGVGSGWNGNFLGAVDAVSYDFGTLTADHNFAVVPEPATWALMIGGFGLVGGTLRTRRRTVAFA